MKYGIVFHPEATEEYMAAYVWYEEKQQGLGERFIQAETLHCPVSLLIIDRKVKLHAGFKL